jgi:hypothetical protein
MVEEDLLLLIEEGGVRTLRRERREEMRERERERGRGGGRIVRV